MLKDEKRYLVILVSVLSTLLVLFVSLSLYVSHDIDALEKIGAYLTGVGQIIVLIWIIATFYLQMFDLKDQRSELSLQRMTLQQQTTIEIYKFEKERLERIARFLVEYVSNPATAGGLAGLSLSDPSGSTFTRFILDDSQTQEKIRGKVEDEQDRLVVMYIRSYVIGFENVSRLITNVDYQYDIRQTFLSGAPMTDLYHLFRVFQFGLTEDEDND